MKSGPARFGPAWICAGCIGFLLAAGAAWAATPTVPVEDIPPTPEDMLSARPGADGLIRNGDESTVERVFVYVDGCPVMELLRPDPGTGVPQMIMLPGDTGPCTPTRGAGTGVAPGPLDGTAGLAADTGLHVRLFREDSSTVPRTDLERLTAPDGQSLIIDISTVDPMAIEIIARGGGGPVGPGGRDGFSIPALPGEEIAAGTGSPAAGRRGRGSGYGGGGYGGGGYGGGGYGGGGSDVIHVSALEPGGSGPSGGPGPAGSGNAGPVPPIPLPASVVLLLGAVLLLAGAVRRLHHRPRRALAALRGGGSVSV